MKFLFLLLFHFTVSAWSIDLGYTARLQKLSKTLRGTAPTLEERDQLRQKISENKAEEFLKEKAKEYITSKAHAFFLLSRLDELFYLKSPNSYVGILVPGSSLQPDYDYNRGYNGSIYNLFLNSLDNLFFRLSQENLSWDQLLLEKNYNLFPLAKDADNPERPSLDHHLLNQIHPGLIGEKPLSTKINFDPEDLRIAGALTTARFFNRYVTTAINKNRRRAAAVFRIFLCDPMSVQVQDSQGNEDPIYDLMLPSDHNKVSEEQLLQCMDPIPIAALVI